MSTATKSRSGIGGTLAKWGAVAALLVAGVYAANAVSGSPHNAQPGRYAATATPAPRIDLMPGPKPEKVTPPSLGPGRHAVSFMVSWPKFSGRPDVIGYGYGGKTTIIDPRTVPNNYAVWSKTIPYVPGTNYFVMGGIYGKPYDRSLVATIYLDGEEMDKGIAMKGQPGSGWAWIGNAPHGMWAAPAGGDE